MAKKYNMTVGIPFFYNRNNRQAAGHIPNTSRLADNNPFIVKIYFVGFIDEFETVMHLILLQERTL